jgi:hypothetical protein
MKEETTMSEPEHIKDETERDLPKELKKDFVQ